jgi:hypothetical protein
MPLSLTAFDAARHERGPALATMIARIEAAL